ncbi:glycosyl hydrolase family 28-related protein [Streptomyces sp. NPDC048659]|uniref:glycosyl hydrolase family 28-related protein n=1 Tax=Streptomyces sp. NPDC048659 TaxID=3155489 RepID=UPI00342D1EB9
MNTTSAARLRRSPHVLLALTLAAGSLLWYEAAPAAAQERSAQLDVRAEAGAVGDGVHDDTEALQRAIDTGYRESRVVYLPAGVYRVDGDLDWSRPASLAGDPDSPAVLFSPANRQLADLAYGNRWDRSPTVDNLTFDGLRINLNGPYKQGLRIARSVFVHRIAPDEAPSAGTEQTSTDGQVAIGLQNVRGAIVTNSVFLSDRPVDGGVPVSTYRTRQTTVSNNLIGADLNRLDWLENWSGGRSWSQQPRARLLELRALTRLPDALGHVQRGMSLKLDEQLTVSGNIVNRDPRSETKRDHALYAWGFNGLRIEGNWLRGWPQDDRGGLKVRNGHDATITGNYLSSTALLLYTYDVTNAPKEFKDVTVCRNTYDIRDETPSPTHSGIMYWRNFSGTGPEDAIALFDNRFIDPLAGAPDRPDISQSRGDTAAFATHDNTYSDGTPVPVLGMTTAPPTEDQRRRCASSAPQDLPVPVYTSPLTGR